VKQVIVLVLDPSGRIKTIIFKTHISSGWIFSVSLNFTKPGFINTFYPEKIKK